MLSGIAVYSRTSKVNIIHSTDEKYIAKCEFSIEGQKISTKASGNRIIVCVDEKLKDVHILLIYTKTDIRGNSETQWWQQEIKNNYSEVAKIFTQL